MEKGRCDLKEAAKKRRGRLKHGTGSGGTGGGGTEAEVASQLLPWVQADPEEAFLSRGLGIL